MAEIVCEWCERKFTTEKILKTHQKSAKYCLKIQEERGEKISVKKDSRQCSWCEKFFTKKAKLLEHQNGKCQIKNLEETQQNFESERQDFERERKNYSRMIKSLKAKIRNLKKENENHLKKSKREYDDLKIEYYALEVEYGSLECRYSKLEEEFREVEKECERRGAYAEGIKDGVKIAPPQTVNNVKIHPKLANVPIEKITPLTVEYVREKSMEYTQEMFNRGVNGVVEFISGLINVEDEEGTVHKNYVCTDTARYKYHRLVESKVWSEDNGGSFLNKIFEEIQPYVEQYYMNYFDARKDSKTEEDYEYYSELINKKRNFFRGITHKNGEERSNLFNKTRNSLKSLACV